MEKNFIVRPYRQGDEEEIIQLLITVFKGWPHFDLSCSSLDYWRWKYEENPLKKTLIAVSEIDNRIIGCTHSTPQHIKIGSKSLLCFQSMDTAVHPDFRRMGLFNKMDEQRQELLVKANANIRYSISGNPFLWAYALKLGRIRFPRPIIVLVRIHDVKLHLKMMLTENTLMMPTENTLIKKYGYFLLKAVNRVRNTLTRTPSITPGLHIEDVNRFDDRIEVFWEVIKDGYSFIQERDREHLNWRYCDSRGGDYVIKQAEEDGSIIGYIVMRVNRYRENYPMGYIIDLLTLPDRLDVADALIDEAIRYFDDLKVNIIACCMVKGHPYEKLYLRHGLLNIRTQLRVLYVPIQVGSEIDEFEKAPVSRLLYQLGDTDHI